MGWGCDDGLDEYPLPSLPVPPDHTCQTWALTWRSGWGSTGHKIMIQLLG